MCKMTNLVMAGSCLQVVQQFCSAHDARCFPSCVVTSLCDSSDDFSTLAQEEVLSITLPSFHVEASSPSVFHRRNVPTSHADVVLFPSFSRFFTDTPSFPQPASTSHLSVVLLLLPADNC